MADVISSLSTYNKISGDKSQRTAKIDTITIHHAAAVGFTAKQGVDYFYTIGQNPYQEGSANYYIGTDGSIGCSVPENYRAWTSSNPANDNRAVTIEVANSKGEPNWEISNASMEALILLVTDICKRNGITKLLWKNDPKLIGQVDKQNMTIHKWFAATGCPGPYLESKMGEIANTVNARLDQNEGTKSVHEVALEVIAGEWGVWPERQERLEAAGYDYNEVQAEVDRILNKQTEQKEIYRVRKDWKNVASQIGAYSDYKFACELADKNPGYFVFNNKGKKLYTGKTPAPSEYKVQVSIPNLNIRKGPGVEYARTGLVTGVGAFTITEIKADKNGTKWGKLKSGAGWICMNFAKIIG